MSTNPQYPSDSVRSSLDENKPDHVTLEEEGVEPEQGNGLAPPLPLQIHISNSRILTLVLFMYSTHPYHFPAPTGS